MKKQLLLLLISLVNMQMSASDEELSSNLLHEFQQKTEEVQLRSAQQQSIHDHLWMTPFLKKVVSSWAVLTQEAKDAFEIYMTAPTFTGDELVYQSGKFKFHFTINSGVEGEDVDSTDVDNNSVPDYIDAMAVDFQTVATKYHTELGLAEVIYDDDDFYHIYVSGAEAGEGTYGYVLPDHEGIVGDNPSSTESVEMDAAKSFMVMRNHYKGFSEPAKAIRVTAAHEYMHAIQYSYDWEIETWFAEGCATWGEEYVFPGYDDNFQYLSEVFSKPDVSLNVADSEGEDFEGHWYGTFLFVQYLVEQTSGSVIPQIYTELIGNLEDESITSEAIDAVLTQKWSDAFSGFSDLFGSYALSSTILSQNEVFSPFVYKRADVYSSYILDSEHYSYYQEADLSYDGSDLNFASGVGGNSRLMRLSYDPIMLQSTHNFKLAFTPDAYSELEMALVKVGDNNAELLFSDDNYEIAVGDNADWLSYYVVIIRWDSEVDNTESVNYSLNISELTTGIAEKRESLFTITPNPASDFIEIDNAGLIECVQILDLAGRLILSTNVGSTSQIDISTLSSGTYLVKAYDKSSSVMVQKLIVN